MAQSSLKKAGASYSAIEPSSPPGDVEGVETSKASGARVWTITLCTIIACLGSMSNGFVLGYSSATIAELNSTETGEHGLSSDSDSSTWFAACAHIGALVGGPVAGWASDRFGRKTAMMLGGVPFSLGWLVISCANSVPSQDGFIAFLLLGRLLTGFATGWMSLCVPVYVSEISTAKFKGLFGACQQLFVTLGIFFVELLGSIHTNEPKFKYYHVSLIALFVVLVFETLMLITKESPRWLMAHGKSDEAKEVLRYLRGPACNTDKELNEMTDAMNKQPRLTIMQTLREFRRRPVYFPFLLAMGLAFFQQFSGINAALSYATTIFQQAKVNNPALVSSFALGGVQVVFTLAGVLIVDLAGRKVLLVVGAVVLSLSTVIIGTEFKLCSAQTSSCVYSPMAIIGFVIYMMAFSIGWGAIPWLMMSELIPQRVKGISSGIVTAFNWLLAVIVIKGFKPYSDAVGPWFAWWSIALIIALSVPFVVVLLPETKGRSLEEIEERFERHGENRQTREKEMVESDVTNSMKK